MFLKSNIANRQVQRNGEAFEHLDIFNGDIFWEIFLELVIFLSLYSNREVWTEKVICAKKNVQLLKKKTKMQLLITHIPLHLKRNDEEVGNVVLFELIIFLLWHFSLNALITKFACSILYNWYSDLSSLI